MDIPPLCLTDGSPCFPWDGCSEDNCENIKECAADDDQCMGLAKPQCKEDGTFCPKKPNLAQIRRKQMEIHVGSGFQNPLMLID